MRILSRKTLQSAKNSTQNKKQQNKMQFAHLRMGLYHGVWNRKEIQLMRPCTCLADGTP